MTKQQNLNVALRKWISFEDPAIEGLKWLALALMTLDHINKFLLHDSWPILFILGRLVFPIFGFVFAYNLARPDSLSKGRYQRASLKLLGFGLLATIPYTMLGGLVHGWWPLNVLFILLAATLHLVCRKKQCSELLPSFIDVCYRWRTK